MNSNQTQQTRTSFTCLTCSVAFRDAELQRTHYKSDWHRYNLKRKVSDLPPVSAEDFQQKVLRQQHIEQLPKQEKDVYCQICRKSFGNQNAFDNHLNSKKHKDNEKNYTGSERSSFSMEAQHSAEVEEEEKVDSDKWDEDNEKSYAGSEQSSVSMEVQHSMKVEGEEEVDSDEWDEDMENPIDTNDCIFCLEHHKNFIKNLEHMTTVHSFFIPDIEYCTDVYGLLRYLAEKISCGFMCLWCNDKGRTFYSADAARQHMVDKGHCRMLHEGETLIEYADFYDYSSSYPDANEEHNADEEVSIPELDGSDFQLVLPSGNVIGHRSLMRYYKQNINPNSSTALVLKNKKSQKVLDCYKSLGWKASTKEAIAKKARDTHYMRKIQAKMSLHLGVRGNMLQKNVRPQVNF